LAVLSDQKQGHSSTCPSSTSALLVKAGEDNPQAREEEGKLYLLRTEHNTSPAGILRMWGSEFHAKATAFTSQKFLHQYEIVYFVLIKLLTKYVFSRIYWLISHHSFGAFQPNMELCVLVGPGA